MLTNVLQKAGDVNYYTRAFRDAIEPCLTTMIDGKKGVMSVEITASQAEVYDMDFFGLLTEIGFPFHLHWVTLRLNGYRSPREYRSDKRFIVTPSSKEVGVILQMYKASGKTRT